MSSPKRNSLGCERERLRPNGLLVSSRSLHGTPGLLARCLLHAYLGATSSDASAVGRTRGQRLAQRWAENPALPSLLRLPPESLAARCTHQQPVLTAKRAHRALLQEVCVRRFCTYTNGGVLPHAAATRAQRFVGAEHQAPQEERETHEAREVARPRSVVPERCKLLTRPSTAPTRLRDGAH